MDFVDVYIFMHGPVKMTTLPDGNLKQKSRVVVTILENANKATM